MSQTSNAITRPQVLSSHWGRYDLDLLLGSDKDPWLGEQSSKGAFPLRVTPSPPRGLLTAVAAASRPNLATMTPFNPGEVQLSPPSENLALPHSALQIQIERRTT